MVDSTEREARDAEPIARRREPRMCQTSVRCEQQLPLVTAVRVGDHEPITSGSVGTNVGELGAAG